MKSHYYVIVAILAVSLLLATTSPRIAISQAPEIVAIRVDGSLKLDGVADEPFWAEAPEVDVPLAASAAGGGHVSLVDIKAAHNGTWLFILAKWRDPTATIELEPGEEEQDRFVIMWHIRGPMMGYPCMQLGTNGAVTQGEVDLWHWHGAEDNPDSPNYGEGGKVTPPHPYAADQYANTQARSSDPGDSFWDIWARGKWSNGVWTLEIARPFTTADTEHDVQFEVGNTYHAAFAVFEGGSGESEAVKSTSAWYSLVISTGATTTAPSSLEERISNLESEISNIKDMISDLEHDVHWMEGASASLNSTISQLKDSLNALESELNDLKNSLKAAESGASEASDLANAALSQTNLVLALSIIAIIVAAASIVIARRR